MFRNQKTEIRNQKPEKFWLLVSGFRLPVLLIALVLTYTASSHAQEAKAEASVTAGNLKDQTAPLPVTKPVAVVCVLPGGKNTKPIEQRIKLAPGQKPLTACPLGATTYVDFGSSPRRSPVCQQCPPPADAAAIEKEQNNLADAQLRALKRENKTPAQQTPGQQPSGQHP